MRIPREMVIVAAAIGTLPVRAGAAQSPKKESADTRGDKAQSPVAFANPELAKLELLVGAWSVTETHFDRRGKAIAEVKGMEEVAWILDHHAIRRSYQTETGAGLYRASCMLTYNAAMKQYRGAWFDNASDTGPSIVSGEWIDATKTLVLALESTDAAGQKTRYKTVEQFHDEKHRVATTYLLSGDEVVKKMEVAYVRTAPCPSGVRGVFNELTGGKN